MTKAQTFDPLWEDLYQQGRHILRYPYDFVVTFVYRNRPVAPMEGQGRVLEVGCGTANNLWFAAREGFVVAGIDASASAIAYAQQRFAAEGLSGDLRVGDFTQLPFDSAAFDLAIDRGALVCCGMTAAQQCLREIWRTLRPGGRFLFNPYSTRHSSYAASDPGPDGTRQNVRAGNIQGVGQVSFYTQTQIETALAEGWQILKLDHVEVSDLAQSDPLIHAEWRVIAEKQG